MTAPSRETEREIRDLYERYGSMVFRRCRRFLGTDDDAWDATQEVFVKLMRNFATIEKRDSTYSWLLSASTNHCISELRKRRHDQFDETIHSKEASNDPPQEQQLYMKEILRHYLAPWDEKTRLVVIYTYIDGYRQDEIVELTGMGASTIRRHLTNFRRHCASLPLPREDRA